MHSGLLEISLICFLSSLFVFALDYLFFHYLTCSGFTKTKQKQAGKPFVTMLVGNFGVLLFFTSLITLLLATIIYK